MIIKERINLMLKDLGIKAENDAEALEMSEQLMEHFNKVIIETMILNLNDEQLTLFKGYLENDSEEELDAHVTELSASIPGLQSKIEEAINSEFETLKSAKKVLDNK